MRKKFLYRVVLELTPEPVWDGSVGEYWWPLETGTVYKHYQSESAAKYRVGKLSEHGIVARVERSNPVTWPGEEESRRVQIRDGLGTLLAEVEL